MLKMVYSADGLPVELMSFSVESDADTEPDAEEPTPDEPEGDPDG